MGSPSHKDTPSKARPNECRMPIAPDDWRLAGPKRYLQGLGWTRKPYRKYRPDWDHDHCKFCWAKLMEDGPPGTLGEGYATQDGYHWVCPTCFIDFKEMFDWRETPPAP